MMDYKKQITDVLEPLVEGADRAQLYAMLEVPANPQMAISRCRASS